MSGVVGACAENPTEIAANSRGAFEALNGSLEIAKMLLEYKARNGLQPWNCYGSTKKKLALILMFLWANGIFW